MPTAPQITVDAVTIEHLREPIGIGVSRPRLSWITRSKTPGWEQSAYEIEIGAETTFSTGRVDSTEQVLVEWPDRPLRSRESRTVRVRVWGPDSTAPSEWSDPTVVEAGILDERLWQATMVSPTPPTSDEGCQPAFLLRGEADLPEGIVSARIRATARGVMTLRINGSPVSDDVLHPGWTSYAKRLRYRTWDVTDLVCQGTNVMGVHLADGWYRGYLGFGGLRSIYGQQTAVLVQLEARLADGRLIVAGTDGSWTAAPGPTTRADLYMGETFDSRRAAELAENQWDEPNFHATDWAPVEEVEFDPAILIAPEGPPVRRTQTLPVHEVLTSRSGRTILDFGQNLVGRLRLQVPAAAGRIVLRHAEVLEDGELGTRPLRRAEARDEVILNGSSFEWEPEFTFHGFRYAEVSGWPGTFDPTSVEAVVTHTDMRRLGTFESSDEMLNRLHENVVWSMRGNFLDVPTDCPQRDERLGWTGDLQVFAPTAAFLYDTAGMLSGWLADLRADQGPDGNVPPYIPWADVDPELPSLGAEAGWGDAATIVPWTIYERTGDSGILRRQWASMTSWVTALAERAGPNVDFPDGGFSFGDWLDSGAADDRPWDARLPWQAVATAYLARSARIVRDSAAVLGDPQSVADYESLCNRAISRFRDEYVTPTGRAAFPAQTAYALGLRFDLLTPEQRRHAGDLLAEQVAIDGFRIGSGFLGTPHVCDALVDTGHSATAWKLLLQKECPSWLYAVTMGATTTWERWNSMLPDGSINPGEMTSFNHYAFGAIADFLHRRVAGLAPAEPGYRRIRVSPAPSQELSWVRAKHETPYGTACVEWSVDDEFRLTVTVPDSVQAEVDLPDGTSNLVPAGTHSFECRLPEEEIARKPAEFSAARTE